jgi:hypothetical protein
MVAKEIEQRRFWILFPLSACNVAAVLLLPVDLILCFATGMSASRTNANGA